MKKLIIASDALRKAMKKLGLAVSQKSILPALTSIYCKVEKDQLELITSDMEITISQTITAETKGEPFEFLLPFDFTSKLMALLGSQPITLEQVSKTGIKITADGEEYELSDTGETGSFPKIPAIPKRNVIKLNENFVKLLNVSMLTAGKDNMRPAMTNACLDIKKKESVLASTDSYFLYTHKLPIGFEEPDQLLFSHKFAEAMDGIDELELSWTQDTIAVKSGKLVIWSRRLDAKFPNYKTIIPDHGPNLRLNRESLIDVLHKTCLSSSETKQTDIYLKRDEGSIHFEYDDVDYGRKGHLRMNGLFEGKTEKISLNAKKLLTLLTQIESDEVNLHINKPTESVLLSTEDDKEYLGLITTLKTNS
jgi:DNA polymerase-3 subunit beta